MTRFARAKGSKSSNEKKEEDPTSWLEMKKAILSKKSPPAENNQTEEVKKVKVKSDLVNPPKEAEWASLGHDPPLLLKHHKNKEQSKTEKALYKTGKKRKSDSNLNAGSDDNNLGKKTKKKKSDVSSEMSNSIKEDVSLGGPNKISKKRKISEVETGDLKEATIKKKKKGGNSNLKEKKAAKVNESKSENEKKIKKNKVFNTIDKKNVRGSKQSFKDKKNQLSNNNRGKKFDKGSNQNFKDKRNFLNNKNKFGDKNFVPNKFVVDEVIVNGEKIPITKFQGFNITLEEAERIKTLRTDLIKQGVPKRELDGIIKLERRRAEKALSRLKKSVCFHCRGSGHLLSNCPELTQREDTSTGICYKCGSTEHTAFECKVVKGTTYQFAECFICKEQGHIAKQCPDNPRGLYPQGGACRECGDVTHLRKDCPKVMSKKSEEIITVGLRNDRNLECLEEEIVNKEKQKSKQEPRKKSAVKF